LNNSSSIIEHKALEILDSYSGANNYILYLKDKKDNNKKFYPTRGQSDYIVTYHDVKPKVARKWLDLDSYFAKKFSEEKYLLNVPEKIYIEKLLVEKEKSYHIWGKFFESDPLSEFWIPKSSIIKTHSTEIVEIDYSKYSHRPPLEHQKVAIEKLVGSKRFILADDMGVGKLEFVDNRVFTPYGRVRIGDLKVGDKIIGSNGKSCNVIGIYPQGVKDLYKMTFNDGYSILVGKEHLWSVSSNNSGENSKNRENRYVTLSVGQMLDENLVLEQIGTGWNEKRPYKFKTYYKQNNGYSKWQIPIVKPIQFERNDILPIDPYLLGLGLGDGSFKNKNINFSVHKDDYDELFNTYHLKENKPQMNKRNGYINVGTSLFDLSIEHTRSYNKFIPDIYKYSSVENRLAILQGLMDTDGHCMISENGNFRGTEFCTISKQLCDDVVEIVQTLGGIARVRTRIPKYTHKGVKKEGKLAYRVNIKLPKGMNPFRLKRKSERYVDPKKYPTGRYIKNIEKVGQDESVCIAVDAPDKLYVTEHCIVTHNTTSTVIASLETKVKKILIICPASLKINWMREIENYTDRSVYIADGKNFSLEHDFVIVNYDILKNFYDLKDKENSLITKGNFDLIILDEAHYASNGQATRTKLVNSITKDCGRVWLLTGTPMTNRPMNYFNLLSIVESPVAQNWMAYAIRYCGGYQFMAGKRKIWNVAGATNLEELRDRTSKQVLRRLKTEVLDLPEKIITPVYLELKSKLYEELMGEYYEWFNKNPNESSSLTIQFSKLMKVRQVISEEKIKSTIELAENILEQGKKVIIFTNFTNTLNKIADHFGKQSVRLDGSTSKPQRQYAVDQFQENEKIKVFVGNVRAAGVGITLTASEAVIMNDLSFVPGDLSQAEDRAYRYGQKNSVSVYYPIFHNTIEGIIYDMVNEKKKNINTVMGDTLITNGGDIVEEILNSINRKR